MQQPHINSLGFKAGDSLASIDAMRGYAIMLVLMAHCITSNVVWPAKRVMLMGVYGVQLFFIASAVTLLMSWARTTQPVGIKSARFFVHRFFRIAPLYFLAIAIYWFVDARTAADFSVARLLASLLFINAWNPYLLPVTGGWIPVPGGWSISVEFCFYLIFPLLAVTVTTIRRNWVFLAVAFLIMISMSAYGHMLYPELTQDERSRFIYFWFPNQLIVFAIGFMLYRCLQSPAIVGFINQSRMSALFTSALLAAATVIFSYPGMHNDGLAPTHFLISLSFAVWALVVSLKPGKIVVNRVIIAIGKVSFSVYIIHFAVLKFVKEGVSQFWPFGKEGVLSLPYVAFIILLTLGISYAIAWITYQYIERPFVRLGKRLAPSSPVAVPDRP